MRNFIPTLSLAIVLLLAIPSFASASPGNSPVYDPYAIPPDKSALEQCRQAVLAKRPGQVTAFQIRNTLEGFRYQFEVHAPDGTDWLTVCDGTSRKVIRSHPKD